MLTKSPFTCWVQYLRADRRHNFMSKYILTMFKNPFSNIYRFLIVEALVGIFNKENGPSPGIVKREVPLTDLTEKCEVQTLSECQLAAANPPFYLISVNSIR